MTEPLTREELITSYIPQVEKWIKGFIAKKPEYAGSYDDLIGEAHLRLVQTADSFLAGKIGRFSIYLRLSICSAVSDFIRTDKLIRTRAAAQPVFESAHEGIPDPQTGGISVNETLALLFESAKDRKDIAILQARLDGAGTIEEIAERSGIPRSTVQRRLSTIKRNYDDLRNR